MIRITLRWLARASLCIALLFELLGFPFKVLAEYLGDDDAP